MTAGSQQHQAGVSNSTSGAYVEGVAPSAHPLLIFPYLLQRGGLTHMTSDWATLGYACVKDHMHFHFLLCAPSQARKPGSTLSEQAQ